MTGDSYPENSFELFAPVLDWLGAYLGDADALNDLTENVSYWRSTVGVSFRW